MIVSALAAAVLRGIRHHAADTRHYMHFWRMNGDGSAALRVLQTRIGSADCRQDAAMLEDIGYVVWMGQGPEGAIYYLTWSSRALNGTRCSRQS